jgi:hypothetical protein
MIYVFKIVSKYLAREDLIASVESLEYYEVNMMDFNVINYQRPESIVQ